MSFICHFYRVYDFMLDIGCVWNEIGLIFLVKISDVDMLNVLIF